jgi:hypothetical protein
MVFRPGEGEEPRAADPLPQQPDSVPNLPPARTASRRLVPESFWGFTISSAGTERRVKISTSGLSSGSRLEAVALSYLKDNLAARPTDSEELRPTEVLRILVAFAPVPGGACPSSLATAATITYQLETVPESGARAVLLAPRVSKGTACFGNDADDTAVEALGNALTGLNRDSISSLLKELQ